MKKKYLAGALAGLMLLGTLASCAGGNETETKPQTTDNAQQTNPSEDTDSYELATKDFNGAQFNILGEKMRDYYTTDAYTGDIISDAVYDRNLKVEDMFHLELVYNLVDWQTGDDEISKMCSSDLNSYSLTTSTHLELGPCITQGCFVNWNDIDTIHTERPWYVADAIDTYSIGETTVLLFGDFLESNILNSWVVIYNKSLAADNQISGLYDVVNDGNWTLEYVSNLVKDVYHDEGGGVRDLQDTYGYVIDNNACLDSFCRSMELSGIGKDEDNQPVLNFYGEKAENAYSQIYNFVYNNTGVYMQDTAFGHTDSFFVTDQAVFSQTLMYFLINGGMANKSGYGILPMPKYSTEGEYRTYQDGTFSAMMIPVTLPEADWDDVGMVTEALNAISYEFVTPMIYERALKAKAANAPEDADMITLILNGRSYSFDSMDELGYPFSPNSMIRANIQKRIRSLVVYYRQNEDRAKLWIANKINEFEALS